MPAVGAQHLVGDFLARELGESLGGGDLHLFGDGAGTRVERPAEDEREAEHVVDLVRKVTAPRGDDGVGPSRDRVGVADLGVGIGEREDDRLLAHGLQHGGRHEATRREPDQDVGIHDGVGERPARIARGAGEFGPELVEVGPTLAEHAVHVDHGDVFAPHAEPHPHLHAARRSGARAEAADCELTERLALELGGVTERRRGDDRRAVLVVVKHGNAHALAQRPFDHEAVRCADVLEVDAAERRFERAHDLDEPRRVGLVDLDVEHVDVGKALEEHRLALHDGLRGERAEVAETEHGRAVRDDGDQVLARRVAADELGVSEDLAAGGGDSGRVGEGKIELGRDGLRRDDLDLSGTPALVIAERIVVFHEGLRENRA